MSKHIIPGCTNNHINNCYPPSLAQPGMVWFDSGTQEMKVFDGAFWQAISPILPSLSFEAEEAIDMVILKMKEQNEIAKMAAKYPLVEEALGQLEVAMKLCHNLENDSTK